MPGRRCTIPEAKDLVRAEPSAVDLQTATKPLCHVIALALLPHLHFSRPTRMDETHQDNAPDDFKIKGAAKGKDKEAVINVDRDAPQDTCVICLEHITERAVAAPCNHLNFDFLCLASWLQEQPTCPLCKTTVAQVQYDWRSPTDYKTYVVPAREEEASKPASSTSSRPSRFHLPRRNNPNRRSGAHFHRASSPDTALAFRRRIYTQHLPSLHVGANRVSQFQNFTPTTFASSAELQSRARTFMRRELLVFSYLQNSSASTNTLASNSNTEFLIEYIIAILRKIDLKDSSGGAQDLVAEFLGQRDAGLFLHELEAWLRSPYTRLEDWDRHVQYTLPPGVDAASVMRESKSQEQERRGAG